MQSLRKMEMIWHQTCALANDIPRLHRSRFLLNLHHRNRSWSIPVLLIHIELVEHFLDVTCNSYGLLPGSQQDSHQIVCESWSSQQAVVQWSTTESCAAIKTTPNLDAPFEPYTPWWRKYHTSWGISFLTGYVFRMSHIEHGLHQVLVFSSKDFILLHPSGVRPIRRLKVMLRLCGSWIVPFLNGSGI